MHPFNTIEEIVLQHSTRHMDIIQAHFPYEHTKRAVEAFLRCDKGVVFIYTGFYVAGFAETDGKLGYFHPQTPRYPEMPEFMHGNQHPKGNDEGKEREDGIATHGRPRALNHCSATVRAAALETLVVPREGRDQFLHALVRRQAPDEQDLLRRPRPPP